MRTAATAGAAGFDDVLAVMLLDDLANVPDLAPADQDAARAALHAELVELALSGSEWASLQLPQHYYEHGDADGLGACLAAGLTVPEWMHPRLGPGGWVWKDPEADVDEEELARSAASGDPVARWAFLGGLLDAGKVDAWLDFALAHPHLDLSVEADDPRLDRVVADLAAAGLPWVRSMRRRDRQFIHAMSAGDDESLLARLGFDEGNHDALFRLARAAADRADAGALLHLSRAGVAWATESVIMQHAGDKDGLWGIEESGAVVQVGHMTPGLFRNW